VPFNLRFIISLSGTIEFANDTQDIESFGKRSFGHGTMPNQGGAGYIRLEVVFILVGFILSQGLDLLLDIRFADFHQERWEKAMTRADDIEAEHRRSAEGAQGFIRDRGMILVYIRAGMDENDLGMMLPVQFDQVFEDLLAEMRETAGFKAADDHIPGWHTQNSHAALLFFHDMLQGRILLIVGQSDTQKLAFRGDVSDQCPAAEFNIIRMGSDEANFPAEKRHVMIHGHLLCGDKAANHLGHYQFAIAFQAGFRHTLDLTHDLLEVIFALEEGSP
jgi:hypothetical protein